MDRYDSPELYAKKSQKESDSNDVSPIKENFVLKSGNGWSKCGWNLIVRQIDYCALPKRLAGVITIEAIKEASEGIRKTGLVDKTPIFNGRKLLGLNKKASLCMEDFGLKLENTQYSGSFKIRGASYQFSKLQDIKDKELITISAGNYGRSFAYLARELGVAENAKVFMPNTVNETRRSKIKALGVNVNCSYSQDKLVERVKDYQLRNGSVFLHPFDDPDVLIGHAGAGLEVLEQMPTVDIVLVCCGGGGFLAGITAAIRLSGNTHTKVYGVEHELASTMFDSLDEDRIVPMKNDPSCTICPGLSAPFPGDIPFEVFRALGDGVILVSEQEIVMAVKLLYEIGLVVEPSGAAAVAAVLSGKSPYIAGKKVVAFVTGGNEIPEKPPDLKNMEKKSWISIKDEELIDKKL
eukprot:gene6278-6999_t